MSETKHTPGPWEIEYDNADNGGGQWFDVGPARHVGSRSYNCSAEEDERAKADAHLIAAAPDLLEALEIIASWDEARHKLAGEHQASLIDIIDSITAHARRTIAKATTP